MADTPTTPEPAALGISATTIITILTAFGVDNAGTLYGELITAALGLASVIVTMYVTRSRVTPVANPTAADGTPLVPDTGVPVLAPVTTHGTRFVPVADVTARFDDAEIEQLVAPPAPATDPLPKVPTIRPFATGLVVEPDDAGVDH